MSAPDPKERVKNTLKMFQAFSAEMVKHGRYLADEGDETLQIQHAVSIAEAAREAVACCVNLISATAVILYRGQQKAP